MKKYLVTWVIDIEDVDNPKEAAEEAFRIMQKSDTTATVFDVMDKETNKIVVVDLLREEED